MKYCLLFFLFLFTLIKGNANNQDTIYIQNELLPITCDGKETYSFSPVDQPIEKIIHKKFSVKKDVNLFYVTGWLWVKFTIKNKSDKEDFVIHASDGHIAGWYMYKPTLYGYQMTPPRQHHPEDGRELYNRIPSFFLKLKKGETQTLYLKVNVLNEIVNVSYIVQDITNYAEYIQSDYMIIGLYFGALLIIIIVNIFYFYSLKDPIFLVYAIYVLGNFLFTATLDGFSWLVIPDPHFAYHVSYFCIRFWSDSMLFFVITLVNLKQSHKFLNTICYLFICYHTFIMAVLEGFNIFNLQENFMAQWEAINWIICVVLALIAILKSKSNNRYLIKYYVILFIILISIFIFFIIGHTQFGQHYLIFEHGMKVGTLLEIITLSFAVSRRFRIAENDLKLKKQEEEVLSEKVKQLEMDVRKAQMNPHFMFNALTSIEYFIFKNDAQKARRYLNKFAQLMRLTLDNSRSNYISLEDEIDALKFYIELEFLRLKSDEHHFEINVNPEIDKNSIFVPTLLMQPFVENAIWHGIQKSKNAGRLLINIHLQRKELVCTIEDNGSGIEKIKKPTNRKSSGILITKERLTLIHALLKTESKFNIEDIKDETGNVIGTRVQFAMPYLKE